MKLYSLLMIAALAVPVFAEDNAKCKRVTGYLEESLVATGCLSPVGLCTVAIMKGSMRGEARYTAASIMPSADTAATTVVFVIGDSTVVNVSIEGKRGTLTIKNAAAYRTTGNGDLVDIQTITGGTGDFAGATGSIRVSGNFLAANGGKAEYDGTVCTQ